VITISFLNFTLGSFSSRSEPHGAFFLKDAASQGYTPSSRLMLLLSNKLFLVFLQVQVSGMPVLATPLLKLFGPFCIIIIFHVIKRLVCLQFVIRVNLLTSSIALYLFYIPPNPYDLSFWMYGDLLLFLLEVTNIISVS
jgi:hypothetical protein